MSKLKVIVVLMLVFTLTGDGFAAQDAKTGFLILAPDRGFVGNEETNALFNKFKNEYPASLALQGRGYGGTEDEYSKYTRNAIADLVRQNVSNIVVLPLFLSDSDSLLKKLGLIYPPTRIRENLTGLNPCRRAILRRKFFWIAFQKSARPRNRSNWLFWEWGRLTRNLNKTSGRNWEG